MDPVQLYDLLKKQAFPMRVFLRDGRCFEIPARQFAVVGRTYLDIGSQADNAPEGVWGPTTTLQLQDIRNIESSPAASPASAK